MQETRNTLKSRMNLIEWIHGGGTKIGSIGDDRKRERYGGEEERASQARRRSERRRVSKRVSSGRWRKRAGWFKGSPRSSEGGQKDWYEVCAAVSRIRMLRTPYNGHSTELKPVVLATLAGVCRYVGSYTVTHTYTDDVNCPNRTWWSCLREFPRAFPATDLLGRSRHRVASSSHRAERHDVPSDER